MLQRARVLEALRYREYRVFWLGQVMAVMGWQILSVAQGWLVYDLTRDPFKLGLVGLFMSIPTIFFSLLGGVIADRVDRQRLLIVTSAFTASLTLLLATLTLTGVIQVWHIYAIAFAMGTVQAFDQPSRQAIIPQLIQRAALMNAIALTSAVWQGTRIIGPALGGNIIAWAGAAACFYITAAGYLLMLFSLTRLHPAPSAQAREGQVMRNMGEGLTFIARSPLFSSLIGMTFFNSLFGMSFVFLMPIFQRDVLEIGPDGLGYLMGASGAGALAGTLVIASLGHMQRRGWLMLTGATLFGACLVLFSFSRSFPLSIAFLVLGGLTNSMYMISAQTMLQALVPDELRGRVMGVYGLTWSLMPLGSVQSGAIARYMGAPFAVMVGGSAVAAFALLMAVVNQRLRRLGQEPLPVGARVG